MAQEGDFGALDYNQQVKVLTKLAIKILTQGFGLLKTDCKLKCVSHWQNTTFRVEVRRGALAGMYALRINRLVSQEYRTICSEVEWLEAISHATDLVVPNPVRNLQGDLLTTAAIPEVGAARHAVLFHWIEGAFLDATLTTDHMREIGDFMGRLHNFSQQFAPSEDFQRKKLQWDGQMEDYYSRKGLESSPLLSTAQWMVLKRVREITEPIMRSIPQDSDVYGLIHNDIYQKNMIFVDNRVCVIDFDNCGWGHYLLDLAVTLAQIRHHDDYQQKRTALIHGYEIQRLLAHQEKLDYFMAARLVLLTLYMASQNDNPEMRAYAPGYIQQAVHDLEKWLDAGTF